MRKKITVPNNGFGVLLMLTSIVLVIVVPFVIVAWGVGVVAPRWVSMPRAIAASLISFLRCVKMK